MAEYRKAIFAFLTAGLGSLALSLAGGVTAAEWGEALGLAVAAAVAVWAVPNAPKSPAEPS